jgi:hypothetical protein
MKTEFVLVTAIEYVSFQDRVNKLLGKGYQIVGTPFSHGTFVCLGMTRATEPTAAQPEFSEDPVS